MNRIEERLENLKIAANLDEINRRVTELAWKLKDNGVPLEAINVEYWPRYDATDANIKIWTGNIHLFGAHGTQLTRPEVIAIVKRQQILRRKF